jgi:hypothetical protein
MVGREEENSTECELGNGNEALISFNVKADGTQPTIGEQLLEEARKTNAILEKIYQAVRK